MFEIVAQRLLSISTGTGLSFIPKLLDLSVLEFVHCRRRCMLDTGASINNPGLQA